MGLAVSAQVIRDLIADGEYLVECIEQRERGKVAVALVLRARALPYSIQIETTDNKLEGLFRALVDDKPVHGEKPALVKLGHQPVPVIEVDGLPADESKARRRRRTRVTRTENPAAEEPSAPVKRRRASARQLVLVPQDTPVAPAPSPMPSKRQRASRATSRSGTR
jgi:hypothetical protein